MTALLMAALAFGDNLDKLIAGVLPTADEQRWLSIPWRLDLNGARAESQTLNKPIFMWMMNGHPMGCT